MQIETQKRGSYLVIALKGRLDAAWADCFTQTVLGFIREGKHHLLIDASEMVFLSSAGIRSLLMLHKELLKVSGEFSIVSPTEFVKQTLDTSGFKTWLEKGWPQDLPPAGEKSQQDKTEGSGIKNYIIKKDAFLTALNPARWLPWQAVTPDITATVSLTEDLCLFGIGSAAADFELARNHFGEFLAVAGNVAFQPPDEDSPPDYLISEKQFVPDMQCIQALGWTGEMTRLIRFAPTGDRSSFTISFLIESMLEKIQGNAAGFVISGEIEGLVGTCLIRSPGKLEDNSKIDFPEIRNWLAFCGERSFSRNQAIITGIISKTSTNLLPALTSAPNLAAHMHAAVFPYQALPNGEISLKQIINKFFAGPPPLAVMHLAEDFRPAVGLGQSALTRGACWFGSLKNPEVFS
jgi:anti-anti-sigma factor